MLKNKIVVGAILLAIGFFLGARFSGVWRSDSALANRGIIIREGTQKLINPILACEVGVKETFAEFKPIHDAVARLVGERIAEGAVKDVGVYMRTLNTGRWIGISEDKTFAPGSLLKVLVMMAYFKEAELNPAVLATAVPYTKRDPLDDGSFSELEVGRTYTVNQLIQRMIVNSDNASLYLLLGNLPEENFKDIFDDLNLKLPKAPREDLLQVVSPKEYSLVFRVLYGATYLDREMSERALELLSQTSYHSGIVADLPSTLTVAHKFGSRFATEGTPPREVRELHDCGIVYYPHHPYFLCVMTKGGDGASLAKVIADVSLTAYQEINRFFKAREAVRDSSPTPAS